MNHHSIDELPLEVLAKIFSFLHVAGVDPSGPAIELVCQQWKAASRMSRTVRLYVENEDLVSLAERHHLLCNAFPHIEMLTVGAPVPFTQLVTLLGARPEQIQICDAAATPHDRADAASPDDIVLAAATSVEQEPLPHLTSGAAASQQRELATFVCRLLSAAWAPAARFALSLVTSVDVSGCDGVTDAAVERICAQHHQLDRLSFAGCRGVGAAALRAAICHPTLRVLNAAMTTLRGRATSPPPNLVSGLRTLSIARCTLGADVVRKLLGRCTNVETLDACELHAPAACGVPRLLRTFTRLRHLDISKWRARSDILEALGVPNAGAPSMETLHIESAVEAELGGEHLQAALDHAPNLRYVVLVETGVHIYDVLQAFIACDAAKRARGFVVVLGATREHENELRDAHGPAATGGLVMPREGGAGANFELQLAHPRSANSRFSAIRDPSFSEVDAPRAPERRSATAVVTADLPPRKRRRVR